MDLHESLLHIRKVGMCLYGQEMDSAKIGTDVFDFLVLNDKSPVVVCATNLAKSGIICLSNDCEKIAEYLGFSPENLKVAEEKDGELYKPEKFFPKNAILVYSSKDPANTGLALTVDCRYEKRVRHANSEAGE